MNSLMTVEIDGLPADATVVSFRGEEALSTPYRLDLVLAVPMEAGDVELSPGADATLHVHGGDDPHRLRFHGVVASAEFVQALARYVILRVELRPRLWKLSLNRHSRVWVDKPFFPDVLDDVLRANGIARDDYAVALRRPHPPMEHIGQYRESDLDFVQRWMEREGVYFFFEQGESRERVVFTDDPDRHAAMPEEPVRFFALEGAEGSSVEALHHFGLARRLAPTGVRVSDHDPLRPSLDLTGEADTAGLGGGALSVFGANLPEPAESTRLARVRAEAVSASERTYRGHGRVFGLRPGYTFELTEHSVASLDGAYLAVAVTHAARGSEDAEALLRAAGLPGHAPKEEYRVEVRAIARATPYRAPGMTPWPRVHGIEAAVVDGPLGDNYAELDAHGRYHVKIRFDESDLRDGGGSCWVRMAQPHAGSPEGFHFPLRKGTEVMLAFLGGDPDRPVIVGAVPDAQNPSAVTDANRTQNVVMTGGENRIEIEDQDGSQYVSVFSPTQRSTLHLGAIAGPFPSGHNLTVSTGGTGLVHTGGNRDVTVDGHQTEDVTGDLTEDYHSNHTTHVAGAVDETIDAGATQTIAGGETRTIHGTVEETITGGETRTVTGGVRESVSAGVTRTVTAGVTDTIVGDVSETVSGSYTQTIGAALTQTVTGGVTTTVSGGVTGTVMGQTLYLAVGGFSLVAPGGFTTIDSQLCEMGSTWMEYYFSAQGTTNLQMDSWAVVREAVGVKIEAVGFKNDVTGAKREVVGAELDLSPAVFKTCAMAIYRFPAMIIT